MPATEDKDQDRKIDTAAPAGSRNSLGAESKLGGRPATGDNVVEAIDEEGPEIPRPDPQQSDE